MLRTQQRRPLAVASPLGDDVLLLHSMTGKEELGRLSACELHLLSEDHDISFDDLLAQNVTVRVDTLGGEPRYFNGYVSRFVQVGDLGDLARYQATVVPWLWFLTRAADCRIFQEMTVPDIIEDVFRDFGFTDYKRLLDGNYPPREYCVQYRETAFDFVSRLMEQEGIHYFFQHENGKHTLVLADDASAHDTFPGYEQIRFHNEDEAVTDYEYIFGLTVARAVRTGTYSLNDYDFESPKKSLQTRSQVRRDHSNADFERYDYPGHYTQFDDGERYARIRVQELQSEHEIIRGRGIARGLAPGFVFELTEHPRPDKCRQYLVTAADYSMKSNLFDSSGAPIDAEPTFTCRFTAVEREVAYRPRRITPHPIVEGPQTATVVGPKGEEIHTDKYGRVKVHFHWDRHGKADENSSCWIRVAQVSAGKKWGAAFTPRIGQEVIVEFLEGNPDRPIITGRVYNANNMPPYELPGDKTISTVRTNSSLGGQGFNEIRFQDKKGHEQLFMHAEKDHDLRVGNDSKTSIGANEHVTVDGDRLEKIGGDKHLTITGDHNEKIDGSLSIDAGMDVQEKVGFNHAIDAGMTMHLKAGMNMVLEAGMTLTLKAGGGFIVIGPTGVAISGMPVLLNSGGSAGSGSGSSPDAPKKPAAADESKAGAVAEAKAPKPPKPTKFSPAAVVLKRAARDGTPFTEQCPYKNAPTTPSEMNEPPGDVDDTGEIEPSG